MLNFFKLAKESAGEHAEATYFNAAEKKLLAKFFISNPGTIVENLANFRVVMDSLTKEERASVEELTARQSLASKLELVE